MSLIRFILTNGRAQHFSQEEHGEHFEDMADRFHRIHENRIVSRDTLIPKTMQLTSMSTQSATVVTADGRTITITEGLPVQISPQDLQPVVEAPVVPEVEPTPEVPVEALVVAPEPVLGADTPEDPAVPASIV